MKNLLYRGLAAVLVGVAGVFVLMGSYVFINKPEIPAELRK
ncbi:MULTISPECIES: cyclic lactone autoinducer peptide [Paenibacillus]|uniref:Cyclic lactone autoinducer peptide n=1 Tax=Paenibacillus lignilyticus TaxID=1172615 RepID=A0ABS5CEB6_9BACL|nr:MULTISPECIES: cyclic lactone autoinducer peptide [Paenibacillus]MBP3964313.1 cyclic lactone autoinducer peptide [Paenibacillus lignilyticus]SFS83959.1 cyclic lactone autoinducer peptide [Paenibacillus sp. BC26]